MGGIIQGPTGHDYQQDRKLDEIEGELQQIRDKVEQMKKERQSELERVGRWIIRLAIVGAIAIPVSIVAGAAFAVWLVTN